MPERAMETGKNLQKLAEAEKDDSWVRRLHAAWRTCPWLIRILGFGLFFAFSLMYLGLFRHAIVDDGYIALDYARTLVRSGTWGMYPGHPANTATSPLNVLLLAAFSLLFRTGPGAVLWSAACCFLVTAVALDAISRRLFGVAAFGWIGTLALLFNPLLISTLGLESMLLIALLVLAIDCYVSARWTWLGLAAGLLAMTRAEGLLFALIFLLFVPASRVRTLTAFALTCAPWYVFSWATLGSLVPDTLFIKSGMASYGAINYSNGLLLYWKMYPLETALSLLFLPLSAMLAFPPVRRVPALRLVFTLGVAHFAGYTALHVPPFHWYYAPDIASATLIGALGLGALYQASSARRYLRLVVQGATVECLLIPFVGMAMILAQQQFPIAQMPILTNWGTAAQYEQVGEWLDKHLAGNAVLLSGEIGTLAYYSPDCYLLNEFSDRHWLLKDVQAKKAQAGPGGVIYRANFLFLGPGPDFPPPAFSLNGYATPAGRNAPHVMDWEISTKWHSGAWVLLTKN